MTGDPNHFVFVNGQFVSEEQAVVSVFDRGFLYGDGLFETLRVFNSKPFRWDQHWERFNRGAEFLKIHLPFEKGVLRDFAGQLITRNQMFDSILRITLTRGVGIRGYSPKGANHPSLIMSLHPAPAVDPHKLQEWRLVTASFRLPTGEALAQFKTCNKLPQVLARAEADAAGADEALLLNSDGCVIEASSSNLFWLDHGVVCTPPLVSGVLPGVTRAVVLEICHRLSLSVRETNASPGELRQTEGLFLSLSTLGIVAGLSLDGETLAQSPLVKELHAAYCDFVQKETTSSE